MRSERLRGAFDGGGHFLLYGATGSGKTEVYLQAAGEALRRGLGVIVLVPEIALAPQTVGRFRARFGDRVAVLHSVADRGGASRRARADRLRRGADRRSERAPRSLRRCPGSGLICVDEEHDAAYKQESDPRYDARTVAAKRASLEGAVAVYGSATPRPESWEALERLDLGERIGVARPVVRVVDLRGESGYPLSAPLLAELGKIVEHGGKAIMLLNRRGIAPALHCRACGETQRCPSCDVSLVLHRDEALHCHHCGYSEPAPESCPACGSVELARIGAGTQRLERELEAHVPELERFRLDADSVEKRGELAETLRRFAAADRAVLLGTQMVAKGHHFADVSLAAVIDADSGLGMPDFRAEERTFQLVTQLAGRSGRDAPGKVLVQTFQPESRAVALAVRQDVEGFLGGELQRRRDLGYPPYRHLVRILVSGPERDDAMRALTELADGLADAPGELLGPAALFRLRGKHRAQLIVKTDRPREVASRAARLLGSASKAMRAADLMAVVDVDPQSL